MMGVGSKGSTDVTISAASSLETVGIFNVGPNWSNPSFIRVDDTSYATVTYPRNATLEQSSYINFSLSSSFASIPAGATIKSTTVGIICQCNVSLATRVEAYLGISFFTGTFGAGLIPVTSISPFTAGNANGTTMTTFESTAPSMTVTGLKSMWGQIVGSGEATTLGSITYSVDFVYVTVAYSI